ncbi:MAG: SLC13 family permease, partial [Candidatus Saccharibacteria bacterium]
MLSSSAWLAIAVFLIVYVLIIWEKFHRTVIAMAGGMLRLVLGIVTQEYAVTKAIDFNTIGLLLGMMIIVGIARKSGLFEYLAVEAAIIARGNPILILISLSFITAVVSAFLDNVTTVLLIVPVTFAITSKLKVTPWPYLFTEIFASNIGGTATLIGDPPNIMIGSRTGLGFMDFAYHLTLPVLVILIVTLILSAIIFRKGLKAGEDEIQSVMAMDSKEQIKDKTLLVKSLFVLALTIAGFVLHQAFHLESATIALAGAALL